jgi:hypothetical protein
MSQQLINRSPDLKRLRDDGYGIQVKGGYLIIHHIPYLNRKKEIGFGKLISSLTLNGDITIKPDNHVIHFMGEYPCNYDGTIITAIQHANPNQTLFDGIILNYSFSNKPANGYADYYEKVTRYAEIITAQARAIDPTVTAKTFDVITDSADESPFNYIDSNASRANVLSINSKFIGQKIGIIGLGGTGSYILDLVAKTPVDEIFLFDGDEFLQHNAFRSPGAPTKKHLQEKFKKVDYLTSIYSNMHKGIKTFAGYVTEENIQLLHNLNFVFICIDSNVARGLIINTLLEHDIPFIDVGLGVNIAEDNLVGTVRVTAGNSAKNDHLVYRVGTEDIAENEYSTNIQIADLNALNAVLAVIRWKKYSGFYQDCKQEHHTTYSINTGQLINEDYKI